MHELFDIHNFYLGTLLNIILLISDYKNLLQERV